MDNNIGLSDSHRFGKAVSLSKDKNFFHKPRPARLESIFLSNSFQNNPFKDYLNYNFNFEIQTELNWSSKCQNLLPYRTNDKPNSLLPFVKLMVLATFTGLHDLHCENILYIKNEGLVTPVPIDIETILFNNISLGDTALIPSSIAIEKFGFQPNIVNNFFMNNLESLMDMFYFESTKLIEKLPLMWDFLEENIVNEPIRIILKPTLDYYRAMEDKEMNIIDLYDEEKFQLMNSDIPYFFSYMGDQNIYYFDSPDTITKTKSKSITSNTDYLIRDKSFFIDKDRTCELLQVSLLQILKNYNQKNDIEFESKFLSVRANSKHLFVETENFIIESDDF